MGDMPFAEDVDLREQGILVQLHANDVLDTREGADIREQGVVVDRELPVVRHGDLALVDEVHLIEGFETIEAGQRAAAVDLEATPHMFEGRERAEIRDVGSRDAQGSKQHANTAQRL